MEFFPPQFVRFENILLAGEVRPISVDRSLNPVAARTATLLPTHKCQFNPNPYRRPAMVHTELPLPHNGYSENRNQNQLSLGCVPYSSVLHCTMPRCCGVLWPCSHCTVLGGLPARIAVRMGSDGLCKNSEDYYLYHSTVHVVQILIEVRT